MNARFLGLFGFLVLLYVSLYDMEAKDGHEIIYNTSHTDGTQTSPKDGKD